MSQLLFEPPVKDRVISRQGDLFLQRIPDDLYKALTSLLADKYNFLNGPENGGRMNLANYFLGMSQSTAQIFLSFVKEVIQRAYVGEFPALEVPNGFAAQQATLLPLEQQGGFSFAYFDVAITAEGLRVIEFQAFPTLLLTSAKISSFLQERLPSGCWVFPNAPQADWSAFTGLMTEIVVGDAPEGVVLSDRNLLGQKTNFEFYATQKELEGPLDVVDSRFIFEQEGRLYYRLHPNDHSNRPLRRLYNRVTPFEAMVEDDYPANPETWRFRFDQSYPELKFVNHPSRFLEISKRLLPYITSPLNPDCYELTEVANHFWDGSLNLANYVWKNKWAHAGHELYFSPTLKTLQRLTEANQLDQYIAQRKVAYELFQTGDGGEKIVELRLMTIQSETQLLVIPMARLGHVQRSSSEQFTYKIHFGDNNRPGYGLCPVLIFEDSQL